MPGGGEVTVVGNEITIRYNVRSNVNKSTSLVWNVLLSVRVSQFSIEAIVAANPNARVSQYSVEAIVEGTSGVRVAQNTIEVLKSSAGSASKGITLLYNTVSHVGKSTQLKYNCGIPVSNTTQLIYKVAGPVFKTIQLNYNIAANVGKDVFARWNVGILVGTVVDEGMNLYIAGGGINFTDSLDLVIYNREIVKALKLYIAGAGVTPDAHYLSQGMNLFIKRNTGSESLDMFISGYDPFVSAGMTLFIKGGNIETASLDISIPNVSGQITKSLPLFINGF